MNLSDKQSKCVHHNIDITHFCETCKELVCNSCMINGPHQTKNHVLNVLSKAYQNRFEYISNKIEGSLREKKDQLIDRLQLIDDIMHEMENHCGVIEKDIQMEFEGGIIKRLQDVKGQKLAVLQKDIAQLQKGINEIDDFLNTFEYLAIQEENVLPLLFMSKTLSTELMRLLSLLVPTQINVMPYDLPRELYDLRITLENSQTLQQQIQFKKEVAWRCRQEKNQSLAQIKEQFFQKMQIEISEWVRLLKRVVTTFDSLCLICGFCGCFMSLEIINEDCKMNDKPYEDAKEEFKCLTEEKPKVKLFGNSQHFFGNPRAEFYINRRDQYPDLGNYYEQKRAAKEIYLRMFRTLWFSIIDLKARKYLRQYNLAEIFAKYDKDNTGWLSVIKFKYLLHQDLEMTVEETNRIVDFFKDEKEDKVNYQYFLDVDWYIDELQRLEDKLNTEQGKYKKLYQKKTNKPQKQPEQEQKIEEKKHEIPLFPTNLRFSEQDYMRTKPIPEQIPKLEFGFGFSDRLDSSKTLIRSNSAEQKQLQLKTASQTVDSRAYQKTQPLKSILKSSSPGASHSRFYKKQFEEEPTSSYLMKYYNL